MSDHPTIEFYWRPGCGFCMLLDRRLRKAGLDLARYNIWDEPEAAAFVRSVTGGDETVPTVVIDGQAMVNPSARQVLAALPAA